MMIRYKAEIKRDGEGFSVIFPDLPGCFSYGYSLEEAKQNAVETLDLYLEEMNDPKYSLPKAHNHKGSNYYWIFPSSEIANKKKGER